MFHYHYFDRIVRSTIKLAELSPAQIRGDTQQVIGITLSGQLPVPENEISWRAADEDLDAGTQVLCGRAGSHHILRMSGLADFRFDIENAQLECCVQDACDPATLRHLLLDQALPRMLGQQGRVVLHASAAAIGTSAVGFVGGSGWGKSTLAACLADGREQLLGDDALLLDLDVQGQPRCTPAYCGARLWEDSVAVLFAGAGDLPCVSSYSSKQRVAINPEPTSRHLRQPLQALFLLDDPGQQPVREITISPLQGSDLLMSLVQRCFLLDPRDLAVARQLWLQLGALLRAGLPVYRLAFPRDFGQLAGLRAALREHLAQVQAVCV